MSARNRLWESFKEKLLLVGMALIITVGFPFITEFAGRNPAEVPGVLLLSEIGYYVLRGAPIVLLLLLLMNLWSIRRRQKQINARVATEGVTYLVLPRADGPPVIANQVTLWHRIALALPYYEHISFEMSGGEEGVVFSLRTTDENTARTILSKVMAEWPGTQMRLASDDPLPTDAYWVEVRAIKKDQPIVASTPDPMKALLSEIAVLPKGVQAGLQVLVREDPFTRLKHSRKADDKTRKKPDPKASPIIISDHESKVPILHPSAEERRHIRWLDERAQEAFVEVSLIIWAASDDDQLARHTATALAKTVAAQYHPNNKLIKGWRIKKGNVQARQFPTFSGRPWVTRELGTIAHLVGKDAQLAAPGLRVAPAKPLPAGKSCRLPLTNILASIHLLESSEELPSIIFEEDLPSIIFEEEPPTITSYDDLPTIIFEDQSSRP